MAKSSENKQNSNFSNGDRNNEQISTKGTMNSDSDIDYDDAENVSF